MGRPRDALTGVAAGRRRRRGRGEQPVVPDAQFTSYYGRPVLKRPVWRTLDIAGYLFVGGLAGSSSVLAAGAHFTDRPTLARAGKITAAGGVVVAAVLLVHDLGRPGRFVNMLRVFKPTSPMSVGSWLLSGYGPVAGLAAASAVTGRLPRLGTLATVGAGLIGPTITTYTAALISDTAVPAWHGGHRQMPYVFAGSGASAAGGLGLLAAPVSENTPARRMAVMGGIVELAAYRLMEHRLGMVAEPYRTGTAGRLLHASEALTVAGLAGAVLGRRNRLVCAVSGAALVSASACMRFGIFKAGVASAEDPKYTVEPQRERLNARNGAGDRRV
jgi:formate-dependent nitrite reductase membrane component NrfD